MHSVVLKNHDVDYWNQMAKVNFKKGGEQEEGPSKAEEPPKKTQQKDFFWDACGLRTQYKCQGYLSLNIYILFSVNWWV